MGPSCNELVYPGCWHFDNGAASKIDNVLIEDGELPHNLPHGGGRDLIWTWLGLGDFGTPTQQKNEKTKHKN